MRLNDDETRDILKSLDFNKGIIVVLDNEQVMRLQIQNVYMNNTEYVKRFVKLLKKGKYVRHYSTMFPKDNDLKNADDVSNLKMMFRLAQLRDIEELDFEIF